MSTQVAELRVVLLPLAPPPDRCDLLLPLAGVAELVRPDLVEPPGVASPDWLCGYIQWRGLRLSLVRPVPAALAAPGSGARVCAAVCVAPSGTGATPFFAIESPGIPRLERITPATLAPHDGAPTPMHGPFILTPLRLRDHPAGLLDLDAVERALAAVAC